MGLNAMRQQYAHAWVTGVVSGDTGPPCHTAWPELYDRAPTNVQEMMYRGDPADAEAVIAYFLPARRSAGERWQFEEQARGAAGEAMPSVRKSPPSGQTTSHT